MLAILKKAVTQGVEWFPENAGRYTSPPREAFAAHNAELDAHDDEWSTPERYFPGLSAEQHQRGLEQPHFQIYGALAQQRRGEGEGWLAPHLLHERGVDLSPASVAKMSIDELAGHLAGPKDPSKPFATTAQIAAAQAAAREARAAGNRELAAQHSQNAAQLSAARKANPPILSGLENTTAQQWIGYAMHLGQHYGGRAHAMWADDPDYATLSGRLASIPGASDYKKAAMMADQLRRFGFVSGNGFPGNSLPTIDSHIARGLAKQMTTDPEKQAFLEGNNPKRVAFFTKYTRAINDDPGRSHPMHWDRIRETCPAGDPQCGSCPFAGSCATGAQATGRELPAGWSDLGIPRQRTFVDPRTDIHHTKLFDDNDQPYVFPEPEDAEPRRNETLAYNQRMLTAGVPKLPRADRGEGAGARKTLVLATQRRKQEQAPEPALPGAAG